MTFLSLSFFSQGLEAQTSDKKKLEEKYGKSDAEKSEKKNAVASSSDVSNDDDEDVTVEDELIYLNATDVEIKDLIKQISKATGTNFLIEDKLRGKITIISEKPMTKQMAYQAFLSALQVMGYTTVMTPGGLVKVIQTKKALSEPLDIFKGSSPLY